MGETRTAEVVGDVGRPDRACRPARTRGTTVVGGRAARTRRAAAWPAPAFAARAGQPPSDQAAISSIVELADDMTHAQPVAARRRSAQASADREPLTGGSRPERRRRSKPRATASRWRPSASRTSARQRAAPVAGSGSPSSVTVPENGPGVTGTGPLRRVPRARRPSTNVATASASGRPAGKRSQRRARRRATAMALARATRPLPPRARPRTAMRSDTNPPRRVGST